MLAVCNDKKKKEEERKKRVPPDGERDESFRVDPKEPGGKETVSILTLIAGA